MFTCYWLWQTFFNDNVIFKWEINGIYNKLKMFSDIQHKTEYKSLKIIFATNDIT